MHLLVIGHTAHYRRSGQIVGWGPTVREIDWLARAFDRVTHLACMHDGPAPSSALPYAADKVRCVFVPPAGGLSLGEKSRVVLSAPAYVRAISTNIPQADVVQVRCPGGLGMYGLVLASLFGRKQRWCKYAANWVESGRVPLSFRFQRWWLRVGLFGGPVTINGIWPNQPEHIFAFDNPSLTLDDIGQASRSVRVKVLEHPIRLVFVGRTDRAKGLDVALEVVSRLRPCCPELSLDVLGDGPERPRFEGLAQQMGLSATVRFHGWVPHNRVRDFLGRAHLMLLPSMTEGWPKVLSEAMAYGVVPIASQVSAIPQVLAEVGSGVALPQDDVMGFVQAVRSIIDDPVGWREMVDAGLRAAPRFSYERYLVRLDEMFRTVYGSSPLDVQVVDAFREQFAAILVERPSGPLMDARG